MRVDVALVPGEARRWGSTVVVLVDELRASSTIVRLLERGASAVIPAASLAEARRLARAEGALLAGEHHVVRAPGFDLGNSPAEVAAVDGIAGRPVVLATRNGTAVLRGLPAAAQVLVGCLLNATAVAGMALATARQVGADVGIVCAGRRGAFAIDDAIAAGCILERLLAAAGVADHAVSVVDGHLDHRAPPPPGPLAPALTDAALAALQLWRSTPDLAAALHASWSGHLLASVGMEADVTASLPVDASAIVPLVADGEPPRIVALRPAPARPVAPRPG
jgi:2-phosphosulfolactate phosphatase